MIWLFVLTVLLLIGLINYWWTVTIKPEKEYRERFANGLMQMAEMGRRAVREHNKHVNATKRCPHCDAGKSVMDHIPEQEVENNSVSLS